MVGRFLAIQNSVLSAVTQFPITPRSSFSRERSTDTDTSAQWDFGYQSGGIANRLINAEPGDILQFRPQTRRVLVAGDSALNWGNVFDELCYKGALLPSRTSANSFVRGEVDLETVWPLGINASAPRLQQSQSAIVPAEHNRWPDWLNAGFFLETTSPNLDIVAIKRLSHILKTSELERLPADHPQFSRESIVQLDSPRSFGKPLIRLPYDEQHAENSFAAGGKLFLLDGSADKFHAIERPFLAYKNDRRVVYSFTGLDEMRTTPLTQFLGQKLISVFTENGRSTLPLYRAMEAKTEGAQWEIMNTHSIIDRVQSRLAASPEGKINYGFNEPRWHLSVGKAAWGVLPQGWELRKMEVPLDMVETWIDQGWCDIGIGIGDGRNPLRNGAMLELAVNSNALLALSVSIEEFTRVLEAH